MKKLILSMTGLVLLLCGISGQNDSLLMLTSPLPAISGVENEQSVTINLNNYFPEADNPDAITFELVKNSSPSVAFVTIAGFEMEADFLSPGQTNIFLKASVAGNDTIIKTVIGVQPDISGDYSVSDFKDFFLEPESFWNGADESGFFKSGEVNFSNDYNPDWFSWFGWAYSNISDIVTPGFTNQYSAITGTGFAGSDSTESNYGVGYVYELPHLSFSDSMAHEVAGFLVTNNTYSTLSMEYGDDYSKKFGGEEGGDPDYFMLIIWGYEGGISTDTVEYYLADYRFENDSMDYLIKTWQWVDLSSLGKIDSLFFSLASSDVGDWGINTPGFFCIDNFTVVPNSDPVGLQQVVSKNDVDFHVYPNPSGGRFRIGTNRTEVLEVNVFNLSGTLIYQNPHHTSGESINISNHPTGTYVIRARIGNNIINKMIQKH